MFWDLFKRKKKNKKSSESEFAPLVPISKKSLESVVVEKCEQMLALEQEIEEEQMEYQAVTNYLNDIQTIENLNEADYKALVETAFNIESINATLNEYLKAEKKISEVQFRQMQELEDEVPGAIKRLKSNEAYLEKVKKDMTYLEAEKTEWIYLKEDAEENITKLRKMSVLVLVVVASLLILILIARSVLLVDTRVWMVLLLFIVTLYVVYYFVKSQDEQKAVKKANACINRAISLENHVKIKYVNMKNAVDYTTEKFHVTNSKEFEYVWDCYNEAVREHKKYQQNTQDMDYFQEKFIRQLKRYHLFDSAIWLKYTHALVDKREMVEVKHDLLSRRAKLREQIEYNTKSIEILREEVERDLPWMKEGKDKVQKILNHFL